MSVEMGKTKIPPNCVSGLPKWLGRLVSAMVLLMGLCAGQSSFAQDRLALIVGINDYVNVPPLQRAVNDAKSVESRLTAAKFTTRLLENPDQRSFLEGLSRISSQIKPGDVVAVYFAGHGVEIDGRNYLIPADIPKVNSDQKLILTSLSVPVDQIIAELHAQSPSVILLILDACRDNPFNDKKTRGIGGTRGLVPVEGQPEGTYVIYSAAANQTALDSLGPGDTDPNSVFARVFLNLLDQPGRSLKGMASELRQKVKKLANDVGHDQFPAVYDQLDGDLVLVAAEPPAPTEPPKNNTPADGQGNLSFTCGLGRDDWAVLENSGSCNAFKVFIEAYQACPVLVALATDKAAQACNAANAPAPEPPPPSLERGATQATEPGPGVTPSIPAVALDQPVFAAISADGVRGLTLNAAAMATSFDPIAGSLDWSLATIDLKTVAMDRQGVVFFGINREGRVLQVQPPETPPTLSEIDLPPLAVSVAVSPDGQTLGVAFADGSIQLLETQSKKPKATSLGTGSVHLGMTFSPDGKRLLSWSIDGAIVQASTKDLAPISRFDSSTVPARHVAFSPDGKRLVAGRMDGTLEILDAKSGLGLAQTTIGSASACITFAGPDGAVVFANPVGALQVWDWVKGGDPVLLGVKTGRVCALTGTDKGMTLHGVGDESGVFSVAFP